MSSGRREDPSLAKHVPGVSGDGARAPATGAVELVRLAARICGMEAEDTSRLGAAFALTLTSAAAFSTFWSFVGLLAIQLLGAPASWVGVMFLFSASTAAVVGSVGGYLSDRLGRRPVIVVSAAGQSVLVLVLAAAGHHVLVGMAIIVLAGMIGAPGRSAVGAVVAELVPPERRERAYASMRLANNLGAIVGPPAAAGLLLAGAWLAFLAGVAALGLLAAVIALVWLPRTPVGVPDAVHGPRRSLMTVLVDGPFRLLLLSTVLGFMVYVAFETVLPVVAVSSFHMAASTWGLLVVINPILTLLLQVRLTRAVERYPLTGRLFVAPLLMGLPFLLLLRNTSLLAIAGVIVVFVFGEMLWVPASQALVSRVAPPALLGTYMGSYISSGTVAWMIAPLISLQLRAAAGDWIVWVFFGLVALLSATVSAFAVRRSRARVPAAV
jgi:MFS family permease